MLTFLLWLSPFIAIAVIVWNYRRKAARREAASNERLKAYLGNVPLGDGEDAAPSAPVFRPAPSAPTPEAGVPVQPSMRFAVRERLLSPSQTLLYYLVKSSLSEYEVLAQVSAASVIDVPGGVSGFEREARQRRLASAVIDVVVCDKSFKAVAVVQYDMCEGVSAEPLRFVRTCCESAGLRWVGVAPDALPKREVVRILVLGA